MDPLGKSPLPLPLFITGKLSLLFCCLFFLGKFFRIDPLMEGSRFTKASAIFFISAGIILLIPAFITLGKSISLGLPRERTLLKTKGIYRISRNPIYLGAFLICIGSCLYFIHPLNFLLCVLTILIHHMIILKEEKFLEFRFGNEYLRYKNQVNRYLGRKNLYNYKN